MIEGKKKKKKKKIKGIKDKKKNKNVGAVFSFLFCMKPGKKRKTIFSLKIWKLPYTHQSQSSLAFSMETLQLSIYLINIFALP